MQFKQFHIPNIINKSNIPVDINFLAPENSQLPLEDQHFLLYIPWNDKYLDLVPEEYRAFFIEVLPHLHARTTDVHTAISISFLPSFLASFSENIDERVVALALILHDSGWSQLSELEIANSLGVKGLKLNDLAMGPKEKHAFESEKIARKILGKYEFNPALTNEEIELICKSVLYHDKPEAVAGAGDAMPIEVKVLVDLDHIWSFTHENFWQDTLRKGVDAQVYLQNLGNDLETYFVTDQGKALAKQLLAERSEEVNKSH